MTDFDRPAHDPMTDGEETTWTEIAPSPIATTPLGPGGGAPTNGPRRDRARWLAAGVIVAMIVAVTAVATIAADRGIP